MLEKMGWKRGDALGANPSKGLKEAISVDMKNDREGVGKEKKERYNWEEKWWEGHFKSAAEKFALAVVEGGGKGGGKDDDDERKEKGTHRIRRRRRRRRAKMSSNETFAK